MNKERRNKYRIELIQEICEWSKIGAQLKTTERICNLSPEGMFIESAANPNPQEVIELSLTLPGDLGNLDLKGVIIWRRWANKKKDKAPLGFAVKFLHSDNTKPIIEALYSYLKNKQIITVSKRIIEEFFTASSKPRYPIK